MPKLPPMSWVCTRTWSMRRCKSGRQQLNADRRERIVAPEIEALVIVVPLRDDRIVFQRCAGKAMHVQMVDVDDVCGFGESLLDVAVLEDATPDDVGRPWCHEELSDRWPRPRRR